MSKGSLIVFSGPSGCGKGTVLKEFFATGGEAFLSVSATTRSPRAGKSTASITSSYPKRSLRRSSKTTKF